MSEIDRIRSRKRTRGLERTGWDPETGEDEPRVLESHPGGPHLPHAPMKRESEVIRKAMAKTGLTEAELRKQKKYRKLFSEAQAHGTKTKDERSSIRLLKRVTQALKLPREHPLVQAEYLRQAGVPSYRRNSGSYLPFDRLMRLLNA